jgi:oligopeptide/dipeptide ABC transporter ATP-binding protein
MMAAASPASTPGERDGPGVDTIVEIRDLTVRFRIDRHRTLAAVRGVNLTLRRGETLGLVGESGSGKSTLALALMRAHPPSAGTITFDGRDITRLPERELRTLRPRMQMIFQDPFASLDPRMRVGDIVAEPLRVHRRGTRQEIDRKVGDLLRRVGLPRDAHLRYPSQFSGGQRQRISIARALALEPELLVADEPVSALDVSIQAQIIALLDEIRVEFGLTTLVIAHDLALVHQITDRIAVMYLGEIVEEGPTDEVVFDPQHPYTASLLSATPVADPRIERHRERIVLRGEPPSPISPPSGCTFHPRCPIARDVCATEVPALVDRGAGRPVACHFAGELGPVITTEGGHRVP